MFLTRGATIEDLILMRKHSAPHIQIKAAGGIRKLSHLLEAIKAGATRIGATATESIIMEAMSGSPSSTSNSSNQHNY
jgi:deoxyribose-phosphate aldolase